VSAFTLTVRFEVDEGITADDAVVFTQALMATIYGTPVIRVTSLVMAKDEEET